MSRERAARPSKKDRAAILHPSFRLWSRTAAAGEQIHCCSYWENSRPAPCSAQATGHPCGGRSASRGRSNRGGCPWTPAIAPFRTDGFAEANPPVPGQNQNQTWPLLVPPGLPYVTDPGFPQTISPTYGRGGSWGTLHQSSLSRFARNKF